MAGALWLLAGCGQKGPLYLPDKKAPAVVTAAPPAAASAGNPAPKKPTDEDASQAPAPK
jgi:predicted small lipoprotein YifL